MSTRIASVSRLDLARLGPEARVGSKGTGSAGSASIAVA